MNDELMFKMAVQMTAAKLQTHFISPCAMGVEDWIADQIQENWQLMREAWRRGHREDNVHPIG